MIQFRITLIAIYAGFQATVCVGDGYNWGNDTEVCVRMKPSTYNMMMEIKDKKYYRLEVNKDKFVPGEKVLVRIMGKTMNVMTKYKGAFLTVVKSSTEGPFGSWDMMHPNKYRSITCSGKMNAAIAEAKNVTMHYEVEDDVFAWNAPNDCMPGEMFQLKGTIVKNDNEILTGLSVPLTCSAMTMMPTKPENSCDASFSEGDMKGTSFENGFGGWWNAPMSEIRWTRHVNGTDSPYTGPSSAYDGDYYIYAEASFPAKPGDRAILNSPPGLNGCFCVRLWCHLYTGPGAYFTIRVNGVEMWNPTLPGNVWMHGWQSVNDPNYPMIQLELTRGSDFRGDLALDKFEISKGLCPEDIKSGEGLPRYVNGKKVMP